ncbi:iron uptake transporter permease EfeU [Xanthobacteraceae bacterium Astr-EGSB]|uniref:iron uptake transporter permease EfeU n=1 Tax=Astrobacterium formosum TaxID=3069710 RepID=UPI0027B7663B|nr:iron uptake transporter permease EfeU [Xanthobacteraceae bacterium Astr-EGSB]
MLTPFLIMLREGLEAALIIGIIAGYLRQTGDRAWLPAIWVGVFLAVALSLFVGAALQFVSADFPQKAQELFEALVGAVAVVVLTSMVFWMRKAGPTMGVDLRHSVDGARGRSDGTAWALIGLAFFAVAREGLESIFFLLAIFQQSPGPAAAMGALAGVGAAVVLGFAIYHGGIRIDLRRFFRWTGVFILLVAAGLLASVLRNLHEAGVWNLLQSRVYDLSEILPVSSLPGAILSGVFNYHEAPAAGEVIVYLAFLLTTLFLFLRSDGQATPAGHPVRPR